MNRGFSIWSWRRLVISAVLGTIAFLFFSYSDVTMPIWLEFFVGWPTLVVSAIIGAIAGLIIALTFLKDSHSASEYNLLMDISMPWIMILPIILWLTLLFYALISLCQWHIIKR